MPTLTQLYEEAQVKSVTCRVIVNAMVLFDGEALGGFQAAAAFGFGQAASATVTIPNPLPAYAALFTDGKRPPIQIEIGFNGVTTRQFTGRVMDIDYQETRTTLQCVGAGADIEIPYLRTVASLSNTEVNDAVEALLIDAGLSNYAVDLPTWQVATLAPIELEFSTYGEAINKLAEVTGSPWFEMPDGQIRVELRDPLPSPSPFRQYWSGLLSALTPAQRVEWLAGQLAPVDIQPPGILGVASADAQPRIQLGTVSKHDYPRNVRNQVTILGAVVDTLESDGSTSSQQIEQTVHAASPFIPLIPGVLEVTISNELVDTATLAADMAVRYVVLYNRLETVVGITVDGDPEIFLGATVQVEDPDYSGLSGNWFVYGYNWALDPQGYTTTLDLRGGGAAAGTTPLLDPFACFTWAQTGKSSQVLPVGIGPGGRGTIVTFDGRCSRDYDGTIASYAWSDSEGNSGTGPVVSFAYDPTSVNSADVTLTVTDNDGNTDAVTKTVKIDSKDEDGSGTQSVFIFAAAEQYASGSFDGGGTWHDIQNSGVGLTGKFVKVACQFTTDDGQGGAAMFVTDTGETYYMSYDPDNGWGGFVPKYLLSGVNMNVGINITSIKPTIAPSPSAWLLSTSGGQLIFLHQVNDTIIQTGWVPTAITGPLPFATINRMVAFEPFPNWVTISETLRALL